MCYYGFAYQGNVNVYQAKEDVKCDDPYTALKLANQAWNLTPDCPMIRLLLVLRVNESTDSLEFDDRAYFQFTSSAQCQHFIENKSEIIWSNASTQKWNGDAVVMT